MSGRIWVYAASPLLPSRLRGSCGKSGLDPAIAVANAENRSSPRLVSDSRRDVDRHFRDPLVLDQARNHRGTVVEACDNLKRPDALGSRSTLTRPKRKPPQGASYLRRDFARHRVERALKKRRNLARGGVNADSKSKRSPPVKGDVAVYHCGRLRYPTASIGALATPSDNVLGRKRVAVGAARLLPLFSIPGGFFVGPPRGRRFLLRAARA